MANEAEQAIYNRLASTPTFHPATADIFATDWGLDAGDVVAVRSGNDTYNVPVYNMSLNWKGNSRVQIQSTGNETRKPLSALKRRQYGGGSARHKEIEEQGTVIETRFIQDETKIGFVVEEKDGDLVVNAAHVVAGINNQDKTSTSYVDIEADYINMTGYVTATTLDARLLYVDQMFANTGTAQVIRLTGQVGMVATGAINVGSVSSTGAVSAGSYKLISPGGNDTVLSLKAVSFGGVTQGTISLMGSGSSNTLEIPDAVSNLQITLSGDTYTLQKKTFSNDTWANVGTFSRATSLSGAWSGSTYTVTASPQNQTLVTALGVQIPANTSSGTATVKLVEIDRDDPTQTTDISTRSLYLKADNDNCYITTVDTTPSSSNTVAQIINPKTGGTITNMTLSTSSSSASSDYSYSGRLAYNTYYLLTATTGNDIKTYKFQTCSVNSSFATTTTVPSGVTPTQIHVGSIYRLRVTVNNSNVRDSYYAVVP